MSEADKLTKQREQALRDMHEMAANPELAKGVVGTVVFDMIRAGTEVSMASIITTLEAIAAGANTRSGLNDVLAKGALKVISGLRT